MKHTSNEEHERCSGSLNYELCTCFVYTGDMDAVWGIGQNWREQRVDRGGYPLMNVHSRYHSGQYLFFIASSTRSAVTK